MYSRVTVAEYFANFIHKKDISTVFELSGGMIAFLSDAIFQLGHTKIINNRHEQASGFAAEAASRIHGKPHIALATSGPGATNLITAIGSSYFDSVPTIFITGQVSTSELKKNQNQRQNGFQELDIVSLVKSITKFSHQIANPEEVPSVLERAWNIATSDRPGPVLIDIPIDIQQMSFEEKEYPSSIKSNSRMKFDFHEIYELLGNSTRPLILAGGGIRSSGSQKDFRAFIDELNVPMVHSLMGKDLLPTAHPLNMGFIGSYGNRWANRALSKADLLLVLGSRLDIRQTGHDIDDFKKNKTIVRVDVDSNELQGRVDSELKLNLDLKDFFKNWVKPKNLKIDCQNFIDEIIKLRVEFPPESEQETEFALSPDACINSISDIFANTAGFCIDVGQHQMWSAQSIQLSENQRFLTSGGMGAMGFAIPAAIGAASTTEERWVVITGDGCAQLAINELQTIFHYQMPITIIVINNQQHGMVAQFQEENLEGRYVSTRIGYSSPNFESIAKAVGIDAILIKNKNDLLSAKNKINENPNKPFLIEISLDNRAKALPKLDRFTKLSAL